MRLHLTQVLKERRPHQCLLILLNGYLCDFQNKIQQENRHVDDLPTHNLEQAPQLPRGHINKVNLSLLTGLLSNKVLPLNVVVLT